MGRKVIEAAEARDEMGVSDVGAELYAVCAACNATHAVEVLRPNANVRGD